MWIATPTGFYSAVQDFTDNSYVFVRARSRGDLERLEPYLGFAPNIITNPKADYYWRVHLRKETWAGVVSDFALGIDYSNFKNKVGTVDKERTTAYHKIWGVMYDVQIQELYGESFEQRAYFDEELASFNADEVRDDYFPDYEPLAYGVDDLLDDFNT